MDGDRSQPSDKRRQRFLDALAAGVASLKEGRVVGSVQMRRRIDETIAARANGKKKAHTR